MHRNRLLEDRIFQISSDEEFEDVALEVFRYQAKHLEVYRDFMRYLGVLPSSVDRLEQVPFLPIEFFKTKAILSIANSADITFTSSGTTGASVSRHLVADKKLYERSYLSTFNLFYGMPDRYAILALLPSYLERSGSSLIYMVDDLIHRSKHPSSGYFLYNHHELHDVLLSLRASSTPTILFGVTYALLDFVERHPIDFPELIVIETGGMKGKRREMVREELHLALNKGFGTSQIHSEYGMTELLSQAYSQGNGIFQTPPWMRISLRDTDDPLSRILTLNKTGAINIVDLANLYSCSFIATQDLGKMHEGRRFEVIGRFDNSDIRGCNLLVQ